MAARRCRPRPPLDAVDRAQVTVRVGPSSQIVTPWSCSQRTLESPRRNQEFVHDRLQVDLLRRDEWEALTEVVAQLSSEHTARSSAGAVSLGSAVGHDAAQQVLVRRGDGRAHVSSQSSGVNARAAGGTPCRAVWSGRVTCRARRTGPDRGLFLCSVRTVAVGTQATAGVGRGRGAWCSGGGGVGHSQGSAVVTTHPTGFPVLSGGWNHG